MSFQFDEFTSLFSGLLEKMEQVFGGSLTDLVLPELKRLLR